MVYIAMMQRAMIAKNEIHICGVITMIMSVCISDLIFEVISSCAVCVHIVVAIRLMNYLGLI